MLEWNLRNWNQSRKRTLSSACQRVSTGARETAPVSWNCAWEVPQREEEGVTLPVVNACILSAVSSVVPGLGTVWAGVAHGSPPPGTPLRSEGTGKGVSHVASQRLLV